MNLRIGQKVICIRNTPIGQECKYSSGRPSCKIQVGAIYTVRDIDIRAVHLHGVATVRLEEIVNPTRHTTAGPWERGYPITCFRPAVDRSTDISVFTEILRTTKAPERALALSSHKDTAP